MMRAVFRLLKARLKVLLANSVPLTIPLHIKIYSLKIHLVYEFVFSLVNNQIDSLGGTMTSVTENDVHTSKI